MAVVPYYDKTKVKVNLRITGTGDDTKLDHWGEEAENEIDDLLYTKALKARRITSLPVLPFASGSVPESVQGAADHYVESRYYEYVKNLELAKQHREQFEKKLDHYIIKLTQQQEVYWRIAR
jgi:hypothetical protein